MTQQAMYEEFLMNVRSSESRPNERPFDSLATRINTSVPLSSCNKLLNQNSITLDLYGIRNMRKKGNLTPPVMDTFAPFERSNETRGSLAYIAPKCNAEYPSLLTAFTSHPN